MRSAVSSSQIESAFLFGSFSFFLILSAAAATAESKMPSSSGGLFSHLCKASFCNSIFGPMSQGSDMIALTGCSWVALLSTKRSGRRAFANQVAICLFLILIFEASSSSFSSLGYVLFSKDFTNRARCSGDKRGLRLDLTISSAWIRGDARCRT